jgi:hypothetical protein
LSKDIKEAKKRHYDNQIKNSTNKNKTTWNIVNKESHFPDRLKYSIIKPLYKKGNKKDVSNYKPISLLTSFSKILGKVLQTRLLDHLHRNNIISKEQYGFWKGLTTDDAVYKLKNEVLNALNNKQIVEGIFCDLTTVSFVTSQRHLTVWTMTY